MELSRSVLVPFQLVLTVALSVASCPDLAVAVVAVVFLLLPLFTGLQRFFVKFVTYLQRAEEASPRPSSQDDFCLIKAKLQKY